MAMDLGLENYLFFPLWVMVFGCSNRIDMFSMQPNRVRRKLKMTEVVGQGPKPKMY